MFQLTCASIYSFFHYFQNLIWILLTLAPNFCPSFPVLSSPFKQKKTFKNFSQKYSSSIAQLVWHLNLASSFFSFFPLSLETLTAAVSG
jgi:hypothetical protein